MAEQAVQIERDRWGRPLINGTPYTRASTIANALEDANGLIDWKVRMTVDGMLMSPGLQQDWRAAAEFRDKSAIADQALGLAGGRDAADAGTALHEVFAAWTTGMTVQHQWLDGVKKICGGVTWLSSEEFGVEHGLQIAGSWDAIGSLPDDFTPRVFDLKTGRLHMRAVGIQLALYALMTPWTPDRGDGRPYGVAQDYGVAIHAPADKPARLVRVDLEQGRADLELALRVREARKRKYTEDPIVLAEAPAEDQDELAALIARAEDKQACRDLWRAHGKRWTTQHTELVNLRFGS